MVWQRLKHLFCADSQGEGLFSHASNPFPERISADRVRIYFSSRDAKMSSHINSLDLNLEEELAIENLSQSPLLSPGAKGAFDESGVSMGSLTEIQGKKALYYLGWSLGVNVPFHNTIGLALWNEKTSCFERFSEGPILGKSSEDPYTLSYPFVMQENASYRMWYGSHLTWGDGEMESMRHVIKCAESKDGISWKRTSTFCFPIDENNGEIAFSRPYVTKLGDTYEMLFSVRKTHARYEVGKAYSKNGVDWERSPEGLELKGKSKGWDREMLCYPASFTHKDKQFLLYCGNSYGKTGFGIAQEEFCESDSRQVINQLESKQALCKK